MKTGFRIPNYESENQFGKFKMADPPWQKNILKSCLWYGLWYF